ncbi:FAD/NAD(P)-binding protein [Streptomyces sp. NRRL B-1347]|uniref:FAD/NAD(P)-binding protein n=1 Tax=Streptomyces sp. NRRL B-1347 TaxID=1476877 RepID=UPI0006897234|nr:FAD/NAD(P)-binding protein [Streptomyces sp. NRRL B-1347]
MTGDTTWTSTFDTTPGAGDRPPRAPVVAVIGAGASGTLAAVQLLRRCTDGGRRLHLLLIDRTGEFGPGVAYRTRDPHHLLNAPARAMSALADDPDHFVRWAAAQGRDVTPGTFLPRDDYGRYLTGTLLAEEDRAAGLVTVEHLTDAVDEVRPDSTGVHLTFADGAPLRADAVILALGVGTDDPLAALMPAAPDRYLANPWSDGALHRIEDGQRVLVLGTGLTMVDVALSLSRHHPRLTVHALSRHGLVPHAHRPAAARATPPTAPPRARSVGDLLRHARRHRTDNPGHWREYVDDLRPHVAELWQQLDLDARRRFLAHVNPLWNVHRHRIAPEAGRDLDRLIRSERLRVDAGHVRGVRGDGPAGYLVDAVIDGCPRTVRADWIVNAAGFSRRLVDQRNPLLQQMLADDVVRPDATRLGIDTTGDGRVVGAHAASRALFALGALRRGTLFESSAVPEIRGQAAAITAAVLAMLAAPRARDPLPLVGGVRR